MPRPGNTEDNDRSANQAESDPAFSPQSPGVAEGEDDGLILWMLSLTPQQRLEAAQGFADSVMALRNGRRA